MDKKISELDSLTSLTGNEVTPVAYNGANYKVSMSTIRSGLAKTTDIPTKITQLTNDTGLTGIPTNGNAGDYLVKGSDGNATWRAPQASVGIEDMLSYGVEWDDSISDPNCTRIGNPLLHKSLPIQSKLRGCVANGAQINYYLDNYDWSLKEDGTASILDGTDGTVRVDTGSKFYGKSGSNGNKKWVRISTVKIDDSWFEIPRMLIDAYRCTVDTTDSSTPKAVSVVNTTAAFRGGSNSSSYDTYLDTDQFRTMLGKPRTSVNRATMRTYAKNAGSELMCYEWYKWILYWLPVIEYATFNMQQAVNSQLTSDGYRQGGLGKGLTTADWIQWSKYNGNTPYTPCGYTNELGNQSGDKDLVIPAFEYDNSGTTVSVTSRTVKVNRYRGFENIFGDVWTNLDGIIIQGIEQSDGTYVSKNVYTTTDSSKFGDASSNLTDMKISGIEVFSDGYTKTFDLGETAEIIPATVGGSETTYKCDYHWTGNKDASLRTLLVGGSAGNGGSAGLGYFDSSNGVGGAHAHVGFRTLNIIQ